MAATIKEAGLAPASDLNLDELRRVRRALLFVLEDGESPKLLAQLDAVEEQMLLALAIRGRAREKADR